MYLNYQSIPTKKLSSSISSTGASFQLNNILSWDGETDLTSADFGDVAYAVFRNINNTAMEIMLIDPSTIADSSITITARGLNYDGTIDDTEHADLKLDWNATETTVELGSNPPQLFAQFVNLADDQTITGIKTFTEATRPLLTADLDTVVDEELTTYGQLYRTSLVGAVDADETHKGIVELATEAETLAGTDTGSTSAYLFAKPSQIAKNIQNAVYSYKADAEASDTYAITLVPAITAYAEGQVFYFKANTANTGAATLNVNAKGAKTIKKNADEDLEDGDIKAGAIVTVVYDGTNLQMQNQQSSMPTSALLEESTDLFNEIDVKNNLGYTDDIDAGETIDGTTDPQFVRLGLEDGELYKADASYSDYRSDVVGAVTNSTTDGNLADLQTSGLLTISSQTLETIIAEEIDQIRPMNAVGAEIQTFATTTDYLSQLFQIGDQVGNISKIAIYTDTKVGNPSAKIELYAVDANGKPTGTALATSETQTTIVDGGYTDFTFTTPYEVNPSDIYAFVLIGVSADGANSFKILKDGGNDNYLYNVVYQGSAVGFTQVCHTSNNSGVTWSTTSNTTSFKTYTTNRKICYGDPVFLSETAGELSLVRPSGTGASLVKIGDLLTQTKMKLSVGHDNKFLGSTYLIKNNGSDRPLNVPIISRMRKAIILFTHNDVAGQVNAETQEVTIYITGKNSMEFEYEGNIDSLDISINENTIEMNTAENIGSAKIYYYS